MPFAVFARCSFLLGAAWCALALGAQQMPQADGNSDAGSSRQIEASSPQPHPRSLATPATTPSPLAERGNGPEPDEGPGGEVGAGPASTQQPGVALNSVGMTLVEIPAGSFLMGQEPGTGGDWDESPVHEVAISRPFLMAATEVTNAQYELFDPGHRRYRGIRSLSEGDDGAVIFVSWHDATSFCEWLSEREGRPYRLPSEAEWEYACRAGSTTAYSTGDELPEEYHKEQALNWDPRPVSLAVGRMPPNTWGLHDMHGNVEEWCLDWYGPYQAGRQADPVGQAEGTFRVTRGGSHNSELAYLRSANRLGTLPEDKHWMIGFRVVQAEMPTSEPLPAPPGPLWARRVSQVPLDWSTSSADPLFAAPVPYVIIPPGSNGPLYSRHNHCPSITWCSNGDILAIWFSTNTEEGREMTILASRLRLGVAEWEPASLFFKAPDRNMTGSALLNDGAGRLYHFNGIEAAAGWKNLALAMHTSTDNGATWSHPVLIDSDHRPRNQVISGTFITREGWLVQPCDASHEGGGGTALHISKDGGVTWEDPGGTIAGIHAGVVQLTDGSFYALGRSDNLPAGDGSGEQRMPCSMSRDGGRTWEVSPSLFSPISSGQRLALLRLREGPLLLLSFTDSSDLLAAPRGMTFGDARGGEFTGYGMFAALSYDDGRTWPVRRLMTDSVRRDLEGGAWTGGFVMDERHAEPRGYIAATQSPDGLIHIVSSRLYYRINLAWVAGEPRATVGR